MSVALAEHPETVIATGVGEEGAFSLAVPAGQFNWLVTIRAKGWAPRQRLFAGGRFYDAPVGTAIPPTWTANFGGPSSSADPDAPAYFLPASGGNGAVIPASPLLPFEDSTVTTIAGDGTNETLWYPGGLAVGADGRILITEAASHNRISLLDPKGRLSVLAGGPITGTYPNETYLLDGHGTAAHFYSPSDVALDPDGNAFVADTSNSAIRKLTPDGTVTTLAGRRPYGYEDGEGTQALFWGPTGVVVDSKRNVFVADAGNFCIRKVTPTGTVTTFAGTNERGYANGDGKQARFRSLSRLAIDREDNLYVTDDGNHRIRKISPEGLVSDAYGAPVNRPDGAVEMPALSQFTTIAVDDRGNLFTAPNERVYRISRAGAVSIAAGYGLAGYADGDAKAAYFYGIAGIALDAAGRIYVTETGNSRVRKIVMR